jgi:hypothetical protein
MAIRWTREMDAAIAAGFENGLSARLIGENLGVTKNAVLGRKFRLCHRFRLDVPAFMAAIEPLPLFLQFEKII